MSTPNQHSRWDADDPRIDRLLRTTDDHPLSLYDEMTRPIEDALDSLMREHNSLFEQLEAALRENGRLALEAATADQDWKRAEAEVEKLKHALTQVRAECDLPDYIAEFVGEALTSSSPNVRKSWGPERFRHDPEQRASGGGRWRG